MIQSLGSEVVLQLASRPLRSTFVANLNEVIVR